MNWWVKCSEQTKAFANMTMALKAENPGVELKPFPACETCYEQIRKISVTNNNGVELYWCDWLRTYVEDGWFCQKHQDFNPDNGGNK